MTKRNLSGAAGFFLSIMCVQVFVTLGSSLNADSSLNVIPSKYGEAAAPMLIGVNQRNPSSTEPLTPSVSATATRHTQARQNSELDGAGPHGTASSTVPAAPAAEVPSDRCAIVSATARQSLALVNVSKNPLAPALDVAEADQPAIEFSVLMWMNLDTWPAPKSEWCALSQGGWEHRFKLSVSGEASLKFTVKVDDGQVFDAVVENGLGTKQWKHVGAVFSSTQGSIKIYINGMIAYTSPPHSALTRNLARTAVPATLGRCHPSQQEPSLQFQGALGDVFVYSGALTQSEVISVMSLAYIEGKGGIYSTPGSPSLSPKLDYVQYIEKLQGNFEDLLTIPRARIQGPKLGQPNRLDFRMGAIVPIDTHSRPYAARLLRSIVAAAAQMAEAQAIDVIFAETEAIGMEGDMSECFTVTDVFNNHMDVRAFTLKADEVGGSYVGALKAGIKHVQAWFVLINPYVEVTAGWLSSLWAAAANADQIRAVVGRSVMSRSGKLWHAGIEFQLAPTLELDHPLPYRRLLGFPLDASASLDAQPITGFDRYSVVLLKTARVHAALTNTMKMHALGYRTDMEISFLLADLSLRLGQNGRGAIQHGFIQYEPRSLSLYENPQHEWHLAKPGFDYLRMDPIMKSFTNVWSKPLAEFLDAERRQGGSGLKVKWVMHPCGSQGQEAANLVRGIMGNTDVRLSIRRYTLCGYAASFDGVPQYVRDMLERLRLRQFDDDSDQVIVYHRDYRELGDWVPNPTRSYVIGRYMWEADGLHTQWAEQCKQLDEIWVPAQFHVELFAKHGVPWDKIYKVPLAVDTDVLDPALVDPAFIPGAKTFRFFSVFKFEDRKGWKELVHAYFTEFSPHDDVTLLIHTHLYGGGGDEYSSERILDVIYKYAEKELELKDRTKLPQVLVVGRKLTAEELPPIYAAIDVFALPTHGEGWGLPIAEAMSMGKPVIATDWSGPSEFVNEDVGYPLSVHQMVSTNTADPWFAGLKWAEPSVRHLRELMRRVFENRAEAAAKGAKARQWMKDKFSVQAVGKLINQHLARIQRSSQLPRSVPISLDSSMTPVASHDARVCIADWPKSFRLPAAAVPPGSTVLGSSAGQTPGSSSPTWARGLRAETGMARRSASKRVAMLSTWPPRMCGLATFAKNLLGGMLEANPSLEVGVVAMVRDTQHDKYDEVVKKVIRERNIPDYYAAAEYLNNNFDALIIQHEFAIFGGDAGAFLVCFLNKLTIPVVTTVHTISENLDDNFHLILKEVVARSARTVVMNEMSKRYADVFHSLSRKTLAVIPHGVPAVVQSFSAKTKEKLGWQGKIVMLSAGLITPGKGLGYVVEAVWAIVQKVPEFLLVIAGTPHPVCGKDCQDHYDWLQDRVNRIGITDNVKFIPRFLTDEDLVELVEGCDFYVTAYINGQTSSSGMGSLALATGRVVIATPYTWAREALSNDRGMLVEFRDAASIAGAVVEVAKDAGRMSRIKQNAYDYAQQMTWPRVARQYLQLVNDVTS